MTTALPVSSVFVRTALLLVASNVFMTFAWYAHLRNLGHRLCVLGAVYFMFRGFRAA